MKLTALDVIQFLTRIESQEGLRINNRSPRFRGLKKICVMLGYAKIKPIKKLIVITRKGKSFNVQARTSNIQATGIIERSMRDQLKC